MDLVGTVRVLDAAFPFMAPGSAAVCIASISGHLVPANPAVAALMAEPLAPDLLDRLDALPDRPVSNPAAAYAHAKRAVRTWVARAAATWGARGVRIVSVSPGMIDTPMGRAEFAKQPAMKIMLEKTPLARLGDSRRDRERGRLSVLARGRLRDGLRLGRRRRRLRGARRRDLTLGRRPRSKARKVKR